MQVLALQSCSPNRRRLLIQSFTLLAVAFSFAAVPWWGWLGGLLGAFYVVCTIFFAQILGAGVLTSIFVTSQLITSILLDYYGIVGFEKRKLRWERILGASFLVVGVLLISLFRGDLRDVAPSGGSTSLNGSGNPAPSGYSGTVGKVSSDVLGAALHSRTTPTSSIELQGSRV